jgi:hypothetical protein
MILAKWFVVVPPKDIFVPIVVPMVGNKSLKLIYNSKSSSISTLLNISNLSAYTSKGNNNFWING